MPNFKCTYRNHSGELHTETLTAANAQAVQRELKEKNYFLISIDETSKKQISLNLNFSFVNEKETVVFTRQLSNLLSSGINLSQALDLLLKNTKNRATEKILSDIYTKISEGSSFWKCLSLHPKMFKPFYVGLVRAGEEGENLTEVIAHLADYMEDQKETKDTLFSMAIYPTFLFVIGFLLIAFIMGFVFPSILFIFDDIQGKELPMTTVALIGISNFINSFGLFILIGIVLFSIACTQLYKQAFIRLKWDKFIYHSPIIGSLLQKIIFARLTRILGLILQSGISLTEALAMSRGIIDNSYVLEQLKKVEAGVINGTSFSLCLNQVNLFTPLATQVVAIGEETGALEETFVRESVIYEKEAKKDIQKLFNLLEPTVILIVALAVGFIVTAILFPIFEMDLSGI